MLNSGSNIPTLLTESDIKSLFYKKQNIIIHVIRIFSFFTLIFFVINYFNFIPTPKNSNNQTDSSQPPTNNEPKMALPVFETVNTKEEQTPTITDTSTPATIPNNTIAYSEGEISSPIVWDTEFDNKKVLNALLGGVTHIKGTSKPGDRGVAIIFGHSSNYPWIKGDYNSVFAGLFKAKTGDIIEINYLNQQYTYAVSKIYEVKPADLSVMNNHTFTGVRLITCSPLGTNLRRLIVEAEQISPNHSTAKNFTAKHFSGTIPESR